MLLNIKIAGGVVGVVKSVEITLMTIEWDAVESTFTSLTAALSSSETTPVVPGEFELAPKIVIFMGGAVTFGQTSEGFAPPTGPHVTVGPPSIE